MIECLLETKSFDIDIRDFSEKTPLHYAALNGADEVTPYKWWQGGGGGVVVVRWL